MKRSFVEGVGKEISKGTLKTEFERAERADIHTKGADMKKAQEKAQHSLEAFLFPLFLNS